MKQTMNSAVARVLKRLHDPLDVILMCARLSVKLASPGRRLSEPRGNVRTNRNREGPQVNCHTVSCSRLRINPATRERERRMRGFRDPERTQAFRRASD